MQAITKQDILAVQRCQKALYLQHKQPDLRNELSVEQKASFERGKEVGIYGRKLRDNGIDVSQNNTIYGKELVSATNKALADGNKVLYEAGFQTTDESLFCITDLAIDCKKALKIIEIKSGTLLKIPEYILDPAFQWKVISDSQQERKVEMHVAFLNRNFVKSGPIDSEELFVVEDITRRVKDAQLEQIPRNTNLNDKQWIEIDAAIENKPNINKKKIRYFLTGLELNKPHYYMDLESFMQAVPIYDSCGPYTHLCFQFCLISKNKDELHRHDFIHEDYSDPRRAFIEALLKVTKSPGIIIVYNQKFEKARLAELANLFIDLTDDINRLISRIRDLAEPFEKKDYYHPKFMGSFSLKKVLPVLVPELSYNNISIKNGVMAMESYANMHTLSKTEQLITKVALKNYCYTDVLAMVKIVEELQNSVEV